MATAAQNAKEAHAKGQVWSKLVLNGGKEFGRIEITGPLSKGQALAVQNAFLGVKVKAPKPLTEMVADAARAT